MTMNIQTCLTNKSVEIEAALTAYLDSWKDAPEGLVEACRYSLLAGGKRLRPALVLMTAELIDGQTEKAMEAACALEMIHTYSLIHDDLPAMDDDDLRRGKPTSHKMFGEATAILAGDALLTMAFDLAAQTGSPQVVQEIAQAAGAAGMVGGQYLDLEGEKTLLDLKSLQRVHAMKTGALIRVALRVGAILAGATPQQLAALTQYGVSLGLAFQITDDILDVVGDEEKLGKPIGSDAENVKSTYPALLGLSQAKERAAEVVQDALNSLSIFGTEADLLRELAQFVLERQH